MNLTIGVVEKKVKGTYVVLCEPDRHVNRTILS